MEHDEEIGLLKMKQPGLIDHIINAVGLDKGMDKGKYTPAGSVSLVKNEDGIPTSGSFNYSSVIEMLLYLSGHTCYDIDFSVNCCSRYMFLPSVHTKRL